MIPSALEHLEDISGRGGAIAVFLDYDGTLTPIVSRPQNAFLSDSTRQVVRTLSERVPVAILSGRDLDDVRLRVGIDGIVYAGSHGFDIAGPGGLRRELGAASLPKLEATEKELHESLAGIAGAQVERKHFSIAAHYRNVDEKDVPALQRAVDEIAARHGDLRKINGKKVHELLPAIHWDKGKAVLWLLETLGIHRDNARPIYIGDDRTDEDAFCALEGSGIGILVNKQPQRTAARYSLKNPAEVERFLVELIARLPA